MLRTQLAGGLLAALTCTALVAGCGSEDPAPDPTTPAASTGATGGQEPGTDLPEASGAFGEAPEFTFPDSGAPEGLQVEVLSEGDGPLVQAGAAVLANYAGIVWGSDATFDDSYSRGAPSLFSLTGVVQGWTEGIPEHPVGSRLLISIPPDLGYGAQGNPGAGIGGEDTIVFVVDIVETYNPDQAGQADATVQTEAADLPVEITGELGQPATVTIPDGAAEPTEVQVVTVAEGSGDPVAAAQSVAAAYAMSTWDGSSRGSSWPTEGEDGAGPFAGAVGQGYIIDAAVDIPVGSRVLVLVPASDSQPAAAWLLDILAAV